jgi:hypothetical protein
VFVGCRWEHLAVSSALLPKLKREWERINVKAPPPCGLVPRTMKLAMMYPADRNRELVAYSAAECTRLGEGEVVWI